jgi:NAD(P)-dependent dehydrogenase (short-subunit alcohol dehydrogenase family)
MVDLRGPVYCSRAVLPGMLRRGRGRIINVSSGLGFEAMLLLSAYAVSKAALYRLSENLAAETRAQGIQVFTIDPGLVHTDMGASPSCTASRASSQRSAVSAGPSAGPGSVAVGRLGGRLCTLLLPLTAAQVIAHAIRRAQGRTNSPWSPPCGCKR